MSYWQWGIVWCFNLSLQHISPALHFFSTRLQDKAKATIGSPLTTIVKVTSGNQIFWYVIFFPSCNNKYPTIRKKKTDVIYFLKRHEKTIQHWWYDFTWQIDCNCRVDERKEHRAFQKPLHLHFSPSATTFSGRVWQSGKAAVASGKFYFDQVVSSWEVTKQRCGSEGNWLYVGGKSSLLSMRCCCCEAASLLYYPRGALIGLHEWWKMTIYRDREIQVAESEKYIFHNNRNTQGNVASSNISLGPGGSGRVTLVGENDIMYKCKWQDFF